MAFSKFLLFGNDHEDQHASLLIAKCRINITMGVYYHPRLTNSCGLSPKLGG